MTYFQPITCKAKSSRISAALANFPRFPEKSSRWANLRPVLFALVVCVLFFLSPVWSVYCTFCCRTYIDYVFTFVLILWKPVLFFSPFVLYYFSLYLQHIQDPWLLSTSDVERERAVDTILTLLQTFRDNMLLTVGGVRFKVDLIHANYVRLTFIYRYLILTYSDFLVVWFDPIW